MSTNRQAVIAYAITIAATAVAMAVVSSNAYADDITIDRTPFVSSMSRDEVSAQLKLVYPGGNPWSGQYNMFQLKSALTSEQVRGEYMMSRVELNALTGEDSGSANFGRSAVLPANAAVMGGPAR